MRPSAPRCGVTGDGDRRALARERRVLAGIGATDALEQALLQAERVVVRAARHLSTPRGAPGFVRDAGAVEQVTVARNDDVGRVRLHLLAHLPEHRVLVLHDELERQPEGAEARRAARPLEQLADGEFRRQRRHIREDIRGEPDMAGAGPRPREDLSALGIRDFDHRDVVAEERLERGERLEREPRGALFCDTPVRLARREGARFGVARLPLRLSEVMESIGRDERLDGPVGLELRCPCVREPDARAHHDQAAALHLRDETVRLAVRAERIRRHQHGGIRIGVQDGPIVLILGHRDPPSAHLRVPDWSTRCAASHAHPRAHL